MTSLQRTAHLGHPTPGAVQTAAQKALQYQRASLNSVSMAGFAAAAARYSTSAGAAAAATGEVADDDDDAPSPVSVSHLQHSLASNPTPHPPLQQQQSTTQVRAARSSAADGMRREWRFVLQFVHVAGQLLVPCAPQWEYEFIDVDRTAYGLAQRSGAPAAAPTPALATDRTPMLAVLSYIDRTAVVQQPSQSQSQPPGNGNSPMASVGLHQHSGGSSGGGTAAAAAAAAVAGMQLEELMSHTGLTAASVERIGDAAGGGAGGSADWWVEKSKHVEMFYCHPAPDMTLESFCKHSVKFILRDPHVVSVDGDSRLTHLRIGNKLRCPHQLGGQYRSFHMRYVLRDRSELQESYVYAIGALVGQRGYLLRARCTSADELEGYVRSVLLPTYAAPGRAQFGVDVTYHNVPPTTLLADQQEAFGELQYVDHKAAIVFVTPVYPMKVLPDYSPAKTVGVGSITCMTLELSVHERLLDDAVAAEIIGVAKYKVNPVVLCVDVEEVSRMGYPKVMSTEQYSDLKARRVADVFTDAKMVGLPTSLYMGNRTGRSRTMTFTYEPLRCVVKALVTSTLVGNVGVTAFYLTKLSGGLFDSHLYVFQQLLSGMEFLPQNNYVKDAQVSRYKVQNIHLGEEDVTRAYRCTPGGGGGGSGGGASGGSSSSSMANATTAAKVNGESSTNAHHRYSLHSQSQSAHEDARNEGERTAESAAGATALVTTPTTGDVTVLPPAVDLPPHPASFITTDVYAVAAARERHLRFLALGNDGRVEGGVEATIPVEEGGMPGRRAISAATAVTTASASAAAAGGGGVSAKHRTGHGDGVRRATAAGDTAARPPSASLFSVSRSMLTVVSMVGGGFIAAAAGIDDGRRGPQHHHRGSDGEDAGGDGGGGLLLMGVEAGSTHSSSRISVDGIAHLMNGTSDSADSATSIDDEEDEEEDGDEEGEGEGYQEAMSGLIDATVEPSIASQDPRLLLPGVEAASAAAAAAAAVSTSASATVRPGASTASASLTPQSSLRSVTPAAARDGEGAGSRSRPTSARRRPHSGHQRSALSSPHTQTLEASTVAGAGGEGRRESKAMAATATPSSPSAPGGRAGSVVGGANSSLSPHSYVPGAAAAGAGVGGVGMSEEAQRQQELYDQLVGKVDPAVQLALGESDGGTLFGPSLRDVYARCCEVQQCRPNSYLAQKLPAQPELTYSVEELDLSSNYVGHNGFVAVLHLLEHLPRLRVVYFNNMSLDNTDVESLCYVLASNMTVREVHLENNTGISLPSTRHFTALLRANHRIEVLALDGTRLSPTLVNTLRAEAARSRA